MSYTNYSCSTARRFTAGTNTTVSLGHAVQQFLTSKPNHEKNHTDSIEQFLWMCNSSDGLCECQYDDDMDFAKCHGVRLVYRNAVEFLNNFLCYSSRDRKKAATTMGLLIKFCIARGYIKEGDRTKEVLDTIRKIGKLGLQTLHVQFDGGSLEKGLQALHVQNYWKKLIDGEYDENAVDKKLVSDSHLIITEVRSDGWEMGPGQWELYDGSERAFLRLPEELARKGVVMAGFSCMGLERCKGVWIPYGKFVENMVCANVYPSED